MTYKIVEQKDPFSGTLYYRITKKFLWFWLYVDFPTEWGSYVHPIEKQVESRPWKFWTKEEAIQTIDYFRQSKILYNGYEIKPILLKNGDFGYYLPNDILENCGRYFYGTIGTLNCCKKRIDELIKIKNNVNYKNETIYEVKN